MDQGQHHGDDEQEAWEEAPQLIQPQQTPNVDRDWEEFLDVLAAQALL